MFATTVHMHACKLELTLHHRKKKIGPKHHQSSSHGNVLSAYNLLFVNNAERRYAITSDDRFENSTVKRMTMRSSVFENRKNNHCVCPQCL